MNKWVQSFLLHPWVNRFNMLYILAWFFTGVFTDLPHVFITGLAIEAAYLGIRAAMDRSDNPALQLRRLPSKQKRRYLYVANMSASIEENFDKADPESKLLNTSAGQAKRMTKAFLKLLLLDHRITVYINSIRDDYDKRIMELKNQLAGANGEMKRIINQNLEIYEKRRTKYFEMQEKQKVIKGRLDTIENTLKLLSDTAVGLEAPTAVSTQLDLLMTNVQDAETFMGEMEQTIPVAPKMRVR